VKNFSGILAARICLGIVEAGLVSTDPKLKLDLLIWWAVPFCSPLSHIILYKG
jgi:hypothetical protein